MPIRLIIDGYNLIRHSPVFAELERDSLEEGRRGLVEALGQYKRKTGHQLTVVFDGTDPNPLSPRHSRQRGVEVLFSRSGQTADEVIAALVRKERERAVVVTSDRALAFQAEQSGCVVVSSPEFALRLLDDSLPDRPMEEEEPGSPGGKKGPARRLPKKARKKQTCLAKL